MKPLEQAQREVLTSTRLMPEVTVPLSEALGLVATADIVAAHPLPPFPNSAMDGFAVIGADVAGGPVTLEVLGESAAGHPSDAVVVPGSAVRIMTGAAIPKGADTIVKVEDTDPDGDRVKVLAATATGTSVREVGSDVAARTVVIAAGTQLNVNHRGVLAALGLKDITVRRRPRIAVLSTGDEVLSETAPDLGPGQIRDTNRPMLLEAIEDAGGVAVDMGIIPDDAAALRQAFLAAAADADLVISSGGVSMGDYDLVKQILDDTGDIEFWKVAMKPAKPFAYGRIASTPFFGLPGNPVSVMVAFEQFARPALLTMLGAGQVFRTRVSGRLEASVATDPAKTVFLRMVAQQDEVGAWLARPAGEQGSHVLSALAAANAFAVVPRGVAGIEEGGAVELEMFRWPAGRTAEVALA